MDSAVAWSALAPDGATPSALLTATDETALTRFGPDGRSLRLGVQPGAVGHMLRRSFAPLDLRPFDELRLWLRADRRADGTPQRPFFLELRVGSADLPPGAPGNPWYRLLPLAEAATWEHVRLSLGDLPAAARSAMSRIELRCVDGAAGFSCVLDDLLAVREEPLADVDAALLRRLHQQVTVNGTAVPAALLAGGAAAPAAPAIVLCHHGIEHADARTPAVAARGDYTANRFVLLPERVGYNLHYWVEAVGDNRAAEARILEFLLAALPPRGELLAGGRPLPLEWAPVPLYDVDGAPLADRPRLYLRVLTSLALGAARPAVPPHNIVSVDLDQ